MELVYFLLFFLVALLYAGASVLSTLFLLKGPTVSAKFTHGVFCAAWVLHAVLIGLRYQLDPTCPVMDIYGAVGFGALLLGAIYVLSSRKYALDGLSAFVTPVVLAAFLGTALHPQWTQPVGKHASFFLPLHIFVNVLGVAAVTLAAIAALAYLIQEYLLRHKQLQGAFQQLPSLEVLDRLALRAIAAGFPLLSLGVITGVLWALRKTPDALRLTASQSFALFAWIFFGLLLILRAALGWRGRRAAVGTLLGFVCSFLGVLGYAIRAWRG